MTTAFFRAVILYFVLVFGLRLMGKRQIGDLEPSELVLTLIIADLASVPMQDNGIPLLSGLIPIVVLLSVATILSVLSTKSIRFRTLLCGRPSVVVESGMVVEQELRKNRLTVDELLEELRSQLAQAQTALAEANAALEEDPGNEEKTNAQITAQAIVDQLTAKIQEREEQLGPQEEPAPEESAESEQPTE